MMTLQSWAAGAVVAIIGGAAAVSLLERYVQRRAGTKEPPSDLKRIPGWLTGVIERAFFLVAVAFDLSGALTAMVAWIAAKMAANWNRDAKPETETRRVLRFGALLKGLLSATFAMLGGLIARG